MLTRVVWRKRDADKSSIGRGVLTRVVEGMTLPYPDSP